MPRLSPSAFSSAWPRTMPTSSTVWWKSTCRSPSASMFMSMRLWRDSRSSMWSKNPTPVWAADWPRPSRLTESSTFVSLVSRESCAVRLGVESGIVSKDEGGRMKAAAVPFLILHPSSFFLCSGRLLADGERLDPRQQGVVLLALADGDADLIGQAGLVPVADQDPLLLEPQVHVPAAPVGGRRQDEVRLALGHAPAHLRQLRREALPLGLDELPPLPRVLLVLDGGSRGGDGDGVAVVAVLHLRHLLDHVGPRHREPEPQARERVRLAHRPRHHH